jgi:hypothetical protein
LIGAKVFFVEIDGEAGSRVEIVKPFFEVGDLPRNGTNDDKGIIHILKNMVGKVVDHRAGNA